MSTTFLKSSHMWFDPSQFTCKEAFGMSAENSWTSLYGLFSSSSPSSRNDTGSLIFQGPLRSTFGGKTIVPVRQLLLFAFLGCYRDLLLPFDSECRMLEVRADKTPKMQRESNCLTSGFAVVSNAMVLEISMGRCRSESLMSEVRTVKSTNPRLMPNASLHADCDAGTGMRIKALALIHSCCLCFSNFICCGLVYVWR